MRITYFHVDAFASRTFTGNPAGVCLLDAWLPDPVLQAIAEENKHSETAFIVQSGDTPELRWFTPRTEVALCGHATLASAFVLFATGIAKTRIHFQTRHSGILAVEQQGDLLEMDFPSDPPCPRDMPSSIAQALGATPTRMLEGRDDWLAIFPDIQTIRTMQPDFAVLAGYPCRGLIVSASEGDDAFVSRFFAPRIGIDEDPATGSAHTTLTPYWANILGRDTLHATQLSKRGAELFCTLAGDRTRIAGRAVLYLEGTFTI